VSGRWPAAGGLILLVACVRTTPPPPPTAHPRPDRCAEPPPPTLEDALAAKAAGSSTTTITSCALSRTRLNRGPSIARLRFSPFTKTRFRFSSRRPMPIPKSHRGSGCELSNCSAIRHIFPRRSPRRRGSCRTPLRAPLRRSLACDFPRSTRSPTNGRRRQRGANLASVAIDEQTEDEFVKAATRSIRPAVQISRLDTRAPADDISARTIHGADIRRRADRHDEHQRRGRARQATGRSDTTTKPRSTASHRAARSEGRHVPRISDIPECARSSTHATNDDVLKKPIRTSSRIRC